MQAIYGGWIGRRLHQLFEASLLIKGGFALTEMMTGLFLFGFGPRELARFVDWALRHEIVEDPTDPMASTAIRMANSFTAETAHFYAIYLAMHGIIKLVMVYMLARRAVWAYPWAMAVLAGFVTYQLYRYSIEPSVALLVLSGLDTLMIGLVWREYRVLVAKTALRA